MDNKRRVDLKKYERTLRTFTRTTRTANKGRTAVHKGVKKSLDRSTNERERSENEGVYASDETTDVAKKAVKRGVNASYRTLRKRLYRKRDNNRRFSDGDRYESGTSLRKKEKPNTGQTRSRYSASRRDVPDISLAKRQQSISRLNERNASTSDAGVRSGGARSGDGASVIKAKTNSSAGRSGRASPRRAGDANRTPEINPRLRIAGGQNIVPTSLSKQTIQTRQKNAFRKNAIQNHIERTQKTVQTAKRGLEAIIKGTRAVFRGAKALWLLVGAAGGQVALVVCVVAIVAAILSPFAFLFGGNNSVDDHPSLAEVAGDINTQYTAKFKSIINDHDDVDEIEIRDYEIDSANYVANNWKDILSIWSVNNDMYRGEKKTDEELQEIDPDEPVEPEELPYVMTVQNVRSLTNMFWTMNEITYEIKTKKIEVDEESSPTATPRPSRSPSPSASPSPKPTPKTKTIKTLIITPVSRDYLWGADNYSFDDDQREWLEDLMSDKFQKEWSKLLLGIVGTEMSDVQRQLLESLAAGPGATIAYNASTRLGHPYSKAKRGQGLYVDCSYLARWCYREAGYDWFTPATAAEQGRWCHNHGFVVERSSLQAGDLLFYSFAKNGRYRNISHVAVYIGRASDGKEYMIDASSSNGFVIYRELFSDKNLVMCGRPLMYLG